MGKNQVKATGSHGRADLLFFPPEDLTIIEDSKHPLYDPRVDKPLEEVDVRNVDDNGILEPIAVRRNGEKDGKPIIEVVFGKTRTRWAREVNKRRRAAGRKDLLKVPCVMKRGDDKTIFKMMAIENAIRHDNSPMGTANLMNRLIAMGGTEEEASVTFGLHIQTVKEHLKLLDLHPTIQKHVETGVVGATLAAQEFSKIPREEQVAKFEELREAGTLKGAAAKNNIRRLRDAKPAQKVAKMRRRKELMAALKALKKLGTQDAILAHSVIKWVLGSANSLVDYPKVESVLLPEAEDATAAE